MAQQVRTLLPSLPDNSLIPRAYKVEGENQLSLSWRGIWERTHIHK